MTDRELIERLRAVDHMSVEECFLDSFLFAKAADRLQALSAEVERLREALGKDAVRFERCAIWIAETFNCPGTLRVERAILAGHMAEEATQALKGANNG